jgi:hypothetical protein
VRQRAVSLTLSFEGAGRPQGEERPPDSELPFVISLKTRSDVSLPDMIRRSVAEVLRLSPQAPRGRTCLMVGRSRPRDAAFFFVRAGGTKTERPHGSVAGTSSWPRQAPIRTSYAHAITWVGRKYSFRQNRGVRRELSIAIPVRYLPNLQSPAMRTVGGLAKAQ